MQRLLRQQVFAILNVEMPDDLFAERDSGHEYNRYIRALENLREQLSIAPTEFYTWLIAMPLSERLSAVQSRGHRLPDAQRTSFRMTLMLAQGVLGRG